MIHEAIYCNTLVEVVTDYLEGGLDRETRADVEVHVATCAGCIAYLDQMRQTVELLGRTDDADEVAVHDLEPLLEAFRDRRGASGSADS